jgi:PAS domain S-box-containing protein
MGLGRTGVGTSVSNANRPHQFERERLAAIVDTSQDAIISKTIDGVITSWNASAERLFGYTAAEAVGQNIKLIIPPDRHAEETEILQRLRRGEVIDHYETVRLRKDGTLVETALTISPLRDETGTVIGASKIARDIGDRKLADLILRQSESRFRSLIEASGAIVYTSDAEARWVAPQPAWEAYTGQNFEQYRDYGWADAIHPEDRARIRELVKQSLAKGTVFEADGRLWHARTRTWRYVEARAVAIRDAEGRVREWVGTCLDVHARKEAEEALRASDRRKDEFLAVLAHELRNPLAPLSNALEILQAENLDAKTIREMSDVARRQVQHLVRLVDDLMEVSRFTRGAIELKREPLLLASAVQGAIEISQPLIDEMGHILEIALPSDPLLVLGDRTRLTQVIANLLNNAAKYTPPRGRIRVSVRAQGAAAQIIVADNGIGIPPAMLTKVFQMFTQIDRSQERTQGGLGIGLSLVRRLVELHGGTVDARSEGRGRGSEFVVRLPLAADVHPAPEVPRPTLTAMPQRRRILVADDNRDAVRILTMLLRTLGQEVHTAFDGDEALERAGTLHPDIILLDIGMPRLSGYEVARRIRGEGWGKDVMLVALTGWGQDQDRRRSAESGFDRHLIKPISAQALSELLETGGRVSRGGPALRLVH